MMQFAGLVQEVFLYFTTFLLILFVITALRGMYQVKMFDLRYLARLRFANLLTYFNLVFAVCMGLANLLITSQKDPKVVFNLEVILLLFVVVSTSLGVVKVKSTLVHGKKFSTAFTYFGIAFLVMTALIIYLKVLKDAGFVF